MKRFLTILITFLLVAFIKLWTIPVHQSRKLRRAWQKATGGFALSMRLKMSCQVGALEVTTFASKVVDLEAMAQKERPDLLLSIHDRSAELAGGESIIKLPRVVAGNVQAMPIADVNMVSQETESQITLTLDDDKGYPIVTDRSTQAETNVALRDTYATNAEDAHYRNRQLLISTKMAGCAAGQRFKYNSSDDVVSDADFLKAKKYLTNANAPASNRYAAIPASGEEALLANPNFMSIDKMGKATVPDGVIGRLRGFWVEIFPDELLAKTHIADGTPGTSGDEVETCYFYHKFGIAYARHFYTLTPPEFKAGADKEMQNLHGKQGCAVQINTFICTFRKNAA